MRYGKNHGNRRHPSHALTRAPLLPPRKPHLPSRKPRLRNRNAQSQQPVILAPRLLLPRNLWPLTRTDLNPRLRNLNANQWPLILALHLLLPCHLWHPPRYAQKRRTQLLLAVILARNCHLLFRWKPLMPLLCLTTMLLTWMMQLPASVYHAPMRLPWFLPPPRWLFLQSLLNPPLSLVKCRPLLRLQFRLPRSRPHCRLLQRPSPFRLLGFLSPPLVLDVVPVLLGIPVLSQ